MDENKNAEEVAKIIADGISDAAKVANETKISTTKSINARLDKFSEVFDSISTNILENTHLLRENLKLNIENLNNIKNKEKLDKFNEQLEKDTDKKKQEFLNNVRDENIKTENDDGFNFPNLGLGIFGGLASFSKVGGLALAGIMGPIVAKVVDGILTESLESTGFSKSLASSLGDSVGGATLGVVLGRVFGKRVSMLFGAAGFAASFGDDLLRASGFSDEDMKKTAVKAFGMEISVETVTDTVLGAMGLGISSYLTSSSFKDTLKNVYTNSGGFGALKSLKGLGAVAALAVGGLYVMYGDAAKKYLEEQMNVDHDIANVAVDTTYYTGEFASIGAMFGPEGALVGAALGLAVGLGSSILGWLQDNAAESMKKTDEELDKLNKFNKKELLDKVSKGEDVSDLLSEEAKKSGMAYANDQAKELVLSTTPATDLSVRLNSTAEGGSELASKDMLNAIGEKISNDDMSKAEMGAIYSNLLRMKSDYEKKLKALDDAEMILNPDEKQKKLNSLSGDANIVQNFKSNSMDTMLSDMLTYLEDKGAKSTPDVSKSIVNPQLNGIMSDTSAITGGVPVDRDRQLGGINASALDNSDKNITVVTNSPTTNVNQNVVGGSSSNKTSIVSTGSGGGYSANVYGIPSSAGAF